MHKRETTETCFALGGGWVVELGRCELVLPSFYKGHFLVSLLFAFLPDMVWGLFPIFLGVGGLLVTMGWPSYLPTRAISAQCSKLPSSGQDPAKWSPGGDFFLRKSQYIGLILTRPNVIGLQKVISIIALLSNIF